MRQSAWLNAVPERAKNDASDAPAISRLEALRKQLKDEHYRPPMPPLPEESAYLVDYLWEMGPTMAGGMGAVPISHQEIQAWQENVGRTLRPWEVRMIRQLSCDYIDELHAAGKRDRPAPWSAEETEVETRRAVARGMKDSIKGLSKL